MFSTEFFHILNPSRSYYVAVRNHFKNKSVESCVWVERSSHPTHLETIVEWALNQGHNHIAIWGGDGTLSRVAQALYSLKALDRVRILLVPVGTCNDFARKTKGGTWEDVVDAAGSDLLKEEAFDLGLIKFYSLSRVFVNNSGFGRTEKALRKHRSNPIKDILGLREHVLQIEWEGEQERQFETYRAFLGIVFNAPYFSNGLHFDKEIEPSDGFFNAFFVPPQFRFNLLKKFFLGRLGSKIGDNKMLKIKTNYLAVNSNINLFPQVDGEPLTDNGLKSLVYTLLPKALHMYVRRNGE